MTAPDPRLNEIQDRLYAVTTGPWEHQPYGGQNQNGDYAGGYIIDGHGEWLISDVSDRDGPFIAAAPADVRYLLAELRKAHEALEQVEGNRLTNAVINRAHQDGQVWALKQAADEAEAIISCGDIAEVAAPVEGSVGRPEAIAARDRLSEEPAEWLRARAATLRGDS